jgi:hypothetical protein
MTEARTLSWTVAVLYHANSTLGSKVGTEIEWKLDLTFEAMDNLIEEVNSAYAAIPFHITGATVDSGNFIMANISAIWDAYPEVASLQSIRSFEKWMATHPDIYTAERLAEIKEAHTAKFGA